MLRRVSPIGCCLSLIGNSIASRNVVDEIDYTNYGRGRLRRTDHLANAMRPPKTIASTARKSAQFVGLNNSQSNTKLMATTIAITPTTPGRLQGLRCVFMKSQ